MLRPAQGKTDRHPGYSVHGVNDPDRGSFFLAIFPFDRFIFFRMGLVKMKGNTAMRQFILRSGLIILMITALSYGTIYHYISTKYRTLFEEEIKLATGLITKAIELAHRSTSKLENEIDWRLYMIAKGISNQLAGKSVHEISRQDLRDLAKEWEISGISLFVKKGDDIVIEQSSDLEEIGLSTKTWGYWHTAFQQLMSGKEVTVPKGFAARNYWVGPVSKAEWDASKFFKYAYYYDGRAEYMINPYLQFENIDQSIFLSGISKLIGEIIENYQDIEEISILNGPAWLKGEKNRVVEPQTDLPLLYGSNDFALPQDREMISLLLQTHTKQMQVFERGDVIYQKHYLPLPAQRVLVIVQSETRLAETITKLNGFFISLLLITFVSMVAILQRITRKQILMLDLERKRLELAEEFKRTMDTLPNLLFKCKRNEHGDICMTYLEGVSLEKMGGQPLMDQTEIPYDQVLPLLKRHERELLRAFQGETVQFELHVGEEFYQAIVKPVYDQGCVVGIAGYATDITDRVRLEQDLQAARDEAVHHSQAKSTFLAMISHELRTPLHSTIGMLELLQDTPLTEGQRKYLETAQTAGKTLLVLINDLLDLTRLEFNKITLNKRVFSISAFMEEITQQLSVLAERKGLALHSSISFPVPDSVVGDSDRLRQILMNLVGNAIKFTERGSVCIHLEKAAETVEGTILLFAIRDTGIGIAPEHIDTIFEPFSQADSSIARRFGGSGLGLTIARYLVELMDGEIWVESEPGRGSTFFFTVTLGVCSEVSGTHAVDHQPSIQDEGSPIQLLLVDDTEENRNLIKAYLSRLPVRIDEASDGQQAVELFQSHRYDLVLLDIQMPLMDGYKVTEVLRHWERANDYPPTPIVALTAHSYPEDVQRSLEVGFSSHLAKPFTKKEFYTCLSEYIPIRINDGE
jgi:signal transduction histidine kinase/ActR/RegA family two-component response regulator